MNYSFMSLFSLKNDQLGPDRTDKQEENQLLTCVHNDKTRRNV